MSAKQPWSVKIKPLGNRVLVRRKERKTTTEGGIVLPDVSQEKPLEGVVLAAGPGKLADDGSRLPMGVEGGDRVLFGFYAGTEFDPREKDLLLMSEDDILAVLED